MLTPQDFRGKAHPVGDASSSEESDLEDVPEESEVERRMSRPADADMRKPSGASSPRGAYAGNLAAQKQKEQMMQRHASNSLSQDAPPATPSKIAAAGANHAPSTDEKSLAAVAAVAATISPAKTPVSAVQRRTSGIRPGSGAASYKNLEAKRKEVPSPTAAAGAGPKAMAAAPPKSAASSRPPLPAGKPPAASKVAAGAGAARPASATKPSPARTALDKKMLGSHAAKPAAK